MNSLKINISFASYITILMFVIGCKSTNKTIEIEQLNVDYPIVLLMNNEHREIRLIEFPLKLKLYNSILSKKTYSSIKYNYEPFDKGIGIPVYIEKNGKLKSIEQGVFKSINPYETKEYIIYTRHYVDTSETTQQQLKPYVAKMLNLSQDTLAIGTVQEFKQKHGALLKQLTAGDSIYLRVLNAERNGYERGVKIPVQF